MRSHPKRASGRRGSAVVEFTICLPVLVSLFLGTQRFGYTFYLYNELEQGVRAGARYASLRTYNSSTAVPDSAYLDAVRNVVVYGTPAGGTQPIVPGLATGNVSVTVTFQNSAPAWVNVMIVQFQLPGVVGSLQLDHTPSTSFPFMGVYAPPVS